MHKNVNNTCDLFTIFLISRLCAKYVARKIYETIWYSSFDEAFIFLVLSILDINIGGSIL